jgi:hypothetical protein
MCFFFIEVVRNSALLRPSLKGYTSVYRMSSGASGDTTMAESQSEARKIIATCREAWGTVHSTQSTSGGVDEAALVVYNTATDKLEELGYSVEERAAELDIMPVEDGPPYP